jgi:ABC-type lipoprotein release transport system permease subunit
VDVTAIIVACLSLIGTLGGSLGGVLVSSKLTNYRIEQLERKVDKHNSFAERIPILEEQMKVANHRIDDLEKEVQSR